MSGGHEPNVVGIYVPKLVERILDDDAPTVRPQLKGFAVGDGCAGTEVLCGPVHVPWYKVIFFYGHGQVSNLLFDDIMDTCGMAYLRQGGAAPPGCQLLLDEIDAQVGGYFEYDLYDDCIYQEGLRRRLGAAPALGGAVNDYYCGGGDAQTLWVNASSVRDALHVPRAANFFNGDNGVGMNYSSTEANVLPIYRRAAAAGLRSLVYNGDADPGINSFVAQDWTARLGYATTQTWRPWTLDGCKRMGGYVTRYEQHFDFLTIRGSGHMVPQFKPAAALEFLRAWLDDADYLPYDASCTAPPKLRA